MNTVKEDGRLQRSARSRQCIVDALVKLIQRGNLMPSAQQVADEAGVAIRTVFRHFSEMESLYLEIDKTTRPACESLFLRGDRSGSLEERILHAVECHDAAYSELLPLLQATHTLLWRSPQVQKNYARSQRDIRKDLDGWLPELKKVSAETREAIDAITSFEFWDRLKTHQRLGKKASIKLIAKLVLQLLR